MIIWRFRSNVWPQPAPELDGFRRPKWAPMTAELFLNQIVLVLIRRGNLLVHYKEYITITKANLSKTVVPASWQNQRVSEGLSRLK